MDLSAPFFCGAEYMLITKQKKKKQGFKIETDTQTKIFQLTPITLKTRHL